MAVSDTVNRECRAKMGNITSSEGRGQPAVRFATVFIDIGV